MLHWSSLICVCVCVCVCVYICIYIYYLRVTRNIFCIHSQPQTFTSHIHDFAKKISDLTYLCTGMFHIALKLIANRFQIVFFLEFETKYVTTYWSQRKIVSLMIFAHIYVDFTANSVGLASHHHNISM